MYQASRYIDATSTLNRSDEFPTSALYSQSPRKAIVIDRWHTEYSCNFGRDKEGGGSRNPTPTRQQQQHQQQQQQVYEHRNSIPVQDNNNNTHSNKPSVGHIVPIGFHAVNAPAPELRQQQQQQQYNVQDTSLNNARSSDSHGRSSSVNAKKPFFCYSNKYPYVAGKTTDPKKTATTRCASPTSIHRHLHTSTYRGVSPLGGPHPFEGVSAIQQVLPPPPPPPPPVPRGPPVASFAEVPYVFCTQCKIVMLPPQPPTALQQQGPPDDGQPQHTLCGRCGGFTTQLYINSIDTLGGGGGVISQQQQQQQPPAVPPIIYNNATNNNSNAALNTSSTYVSFRDHYSNTRGNVILREPKKRAGRSKGYDRESVSSMRPAGFNSEKGDSTADCLHIYD